MRSKAMDTGTSSTFSTCSLWQDSTTQLRMPNLGGESLPVRDRVPSMDQDRGVLLRIRWSI